MISESHTTEAFKDYINSASHMYASLFNYEHSMESFDHYATENNTLVSVDNSTGLNTQIESTMRREDGKTGWVCIVCGKTAQKSNIAQHIEAKHLEGVSYTCTLRGKDSRSADGLRLPRSKDHRN